MLATEIGALKSNRFTFLNSSPWICFRSNEKPIRFQESENLLKQALPEQFHPHIIELNAYLCDSFGNSTRLDYGTGKPMRELNVDRKSRL